MNTKCPVLTSFIANWNNYLSDQERESVTRPLIQDLQQASDTSQAQARRRHMALDWHLHNALPAWLDLAGLNTQAATLKQFSQDIFKQGTEQQEALDFFDQVNTLLVDDVNSLSSANPIGTSRTLIRAAALATGSSGERAALQAAARPHIDYRPWLLLNRVDITAPHAAILTVLKAHRKSRSTDPATTIKATLAAPAAKRIQESAVQLFRNMTAV